MKTIGKWIVDTNIVVHWLMASQIMQFAIQEFHLGQEFLNVYRNRYKHSFGFINRVLELTENSDTFGITELSLNELFSGIRDEIRTIMLFVRGVPISRWAYKRETMEVRFPEELSRNIYELTLGGFDTLIGSKKIEIIPTTVPSDARYYFDVYSYLVFLNPGLTTQDAILVTTAIFEKADYFVTMDRDVIRLGRKLKDKYDLEVLTPGRAMQTIR